MFNDDYRKKAQEDYELKVASDRLDGASKARNDINQYVREHREKYFYNLAFLSAGAIALSVNYLTAKSEMLSWQWVLVVSWVLLLISLSLCLLRNYLYGSFLHYGMQSVWVGAKLEQERKLIPVLEGGQVMHAQTEKEISDEIKIKNNNVKILEDGLGFNKGKEKKFAKIWTSFQLVGQVTFILGLTAMVVFGLLNILLPPK
jgi:hypothetical protein